MAKRKKKLKKYKKGKIVFPPDRKVWCVMCCQNVSGYHTCYDWIPLFVESFGVCKEQYKIDEIRRICERRDR